VKSRIVEYRLTEYYCPQ